jgi:hypothetical protein
MHMIDVIGEGFEFNPASHRGACAGAHCTSPFGRTWRLASSSANHAIPALPLTSTSQDRPSIPAEHTMAATSDFACSRQTERHLCSFAVGNEVRLPDALCVVTADTSHICVATPPTRLDFL